MKASCGFFAQALIYLLNVTSAFEQLIELRKRLIYALIAFFAVFFITFYFAKPIFSFLIQPALNQGYKLIVLDEDIVLRS